MYCRNCGKTIEEDDIDWCPTCGPKKGLSFEDLLKLDENEMQLLKVHGMDKTLTKILQSIHEVKYGKDS